MSKTFIEQSRLYGAVFDIVEQSKSNTISYQQVVTLEAALPGLIIALTPVHGLTEHASVENFQKVKEAVSNAINKMIEKIKQFIKTVMGWFRTDGKELQNTSKVASDIKHKEQEFKQTIESTPDSKSVESPPKSSNTPVDISSYDPYNPKNQPDGRAVFDIGLLSLNAMSAQQIIAIVKNRHATVDQVMLKMLANRIDIPMMWLTIPERDSLMRELLGFNWERMSKVFSNYTKTVESTGEDGYDGVIWSRLNGAAYSHGLDSLAWLDDVKGVCDKLTDKYVKEDSYYNNSGAHSNDVEHNSSLYAYYAVFFKSRNDLRGGTNYTGAHQQVTKESVEGSLDCIKSYAGDLLIELGSLAKCLTILEGTDAMFKKYNLVQGNHMSSDSYRLGGKSVQEWVLLIAMATRTYNLVLKGFEIIIKRLRAYTGDLDKLIGKA